MCGLLLTSLPCPRGFSLSRDVEDAGRESIRPHDIPWKRDSDNDFIWNPRGGSINSKKGDTIKLSAQIEQKKGEGTLNSGNSEQHSRKMYSLYIIYLINNAYHAQN